tara:strand:- start:87 stop:368 length:282 start_codon:yes stop_codon:yes gene_type:complete
MAGPIKAYNWAQGTSAGIVGPSRSRLRGVRIYGNADGAFTFKNGSNSGEVILTQKFKTGDSDVYIPDDGILATEGVYVSAFTGSSNELTILLS